MNEIWQRRIDCICRNSKNRQAKNSESNDEAVEENDQNNKLIPSFILIIIHQTHYEKSDWSRACNQFTIACELDMINAISAADIAFIMSSSTSAWLLSPLECSPQKQNGWTLRFCFWGWIMWKMYNKVIIEFGFRMVSCSTSYNNCLIFQFPF